MYNRSFLPCPGCGELFRDWTTCLIHMRDCETTTKLPEPSSLEGKENVTPAGNFDATNKPQSLLETEINSGSLKTAYALVDNIGNNTSVTVMEESSSASLQPNSGATTNPTRPSLTIYNQRVLNLLSEHPTGMTWREMIGKFPGLSNYINAEIAARKEYSDPVRFLSNKFHGIKVTKRRDGMFLFSLCDEAPRSKDMTKVPSLLPRGSFQSKSPLSMFGKDVTNILSPCRPLEVPDSSPFRPFAIIDRIGAIAAPTHSKLSLPVSTKKDATKEMSPTVSLKKTRKAATTISEIHNLTSKERNDNRLSFLNEARNTSEAPLVMQDQQPKKGDSGESHSVAQNISRTCCASLSCCRRVERLLSKNPWGLTQKAIERLEPGSSGYLREAMRNKKRTAGDVGLSSPFDSIRLKKRQDGSSLFVLRDAQKADTDNTLP
jgi:hypothetical protein